MARCSSVAAAIFFLWASAVEPWSPAPWLHHSKRNGLRKQLPFPKFGSTTSMLAASCRRSDVWLCLSATTTESSVAHPDLILFNTKSRKKEELKTLEPGNVSMYTCGPTVYDSAHVGNFRAFLTYDVLKRVLSYLGYKVTHVCNLTDVDDKIIQKCQKLNTDLHTLTRKYEQAFMDDLDALNIVRADEYPRATEHIPEMVEMVQMLEKNGLAYQTEEGSWYFSVEKKEGYGQQLVHLQFEDMESTDRATGEEDKRGPFDFCLWKAYKPGVDREDAIWDTPLGKGRPGWHLECSAMARKYLGDTIDIHGGGVDLKFPHHENEIAQSEGATGNPFCNCWIHNGFVNINDEKMSKSTGNFLTLRDACPKATDVRAYRYLVVSSHYRNPLSFTKQAMSAAKGALKRMDKLREAIDVVLKDASFLTSEEESEIASRVVPAQLKNFEEALVDDLSMPRAAAALFGCVKAAENEFKRVKKAEKDDSTDARLDLVGMSAVRDAIDQMDQVFGIFYDVPLTEEEKAISAASEVNGDAVPSEVMELVQQRTVAKDAKDWELADSLRARITELGFVVKDVKGGEPIVSPVAD